MPDRETERRVVELKAGGPDDPDGARTAAVLAAYFRAEHMKAFCRLLWIRLSIFAVVWLLIATVLGLPKVAVLVTLALLAVVATWAAVATWRAVRTVDRLIRDRPHF